MADDRPGYAEAALERAGLSSGKRLLHVLSFGRIRVAIPFLLPDGRAPLMRRVPNGGLVVHPTLAESIGVCFWLVSFAAAFALYRSYPA